MGITCRLVEMSNLRQALAIFFGVFTPLALVSVTLCLGDDADSCSVVYIVGWASRGAGIVLLFWFLMRPDADELPQTSLGSRMWARMRLPQRGTNRYVALSVLMMVIWGLVFGVIDDELATLGNWVYAALVGASFGILMAVTERRARRR